MAVAGERGRLWMGPVPGEEPEGLVAEIAVACDGDARDVLDRVRNVLALVFAREDPRTLSLTDWCRRLPSWFVVGFALPPEERGATLGTWSLADWLYWFEPHRRSWSWWDATVVDGMVRVRLVVDHLPYAAGSLEWLLRCAGAKLTGFNAPVDVRDRLTHA